MNIIFYNKQTYLRVSIRQCLKHIFKLNITSFKKQYMLIINQKGENTFWINCIRQQSTM